MAINYELINKGGISLSANFELLSNKPLDARLVVPTLSGLQNLIDNAAAYAGMVVYVTEKAKHYQVNTDGSYREFGITTDELKALIATETTAAMEFKGATSAIPASANKGDMYKVSASFTVAAANDAQGVGFTTKVGDSIVYDGAKWYIVPTGDDIEDTWRPVTNVANDATLTFAAGDKLDVAVASNGTVTYSHEAIETANKGTETETRTYISSIETDGHGHITGYKTATENVEDTNTTYDFECAAEHSNVYFTVKEKNGEEEVAHTVCVDAYNKNEVNTELAKKLDANGWTNENGSLISRENPDDVGKYAGISFNHISVGDDNAHSFAALDPQGSLNLCEYGDTYTSYKRGCITNSFEGPEDASYSADLTLPTTSGTLALQADVDTKLNGTGWTNENGVISSVPSVPSWSGKEWNITLSNEDGIRFCDTGVEGDCVHIQPEGIKITNGNPTFISALGIVPGGSSLDMNNLISYPGLGHGKDEFAVKSQVDAVKEYADDTFLRTQCTLEHDYHAANWGACNGFSGLQFSSNKYGEEGGHNSSPLCTVIGDYGLHIHDGQYETYTTYREGYITRRTAIFNEDGSFKENSSVNISLPETSGTIALTSDIVNYHRDYQSGTIMDINHNNATDPSFITGITIQNGHVTGATVQNLKEVLQSLTVVLDGGTLKIG